MLGKYTHLLMKDINELTEGEAVIVIEELLKTKELSEVVEQLTEKFNLQDMDFEDITDITTDDLSEYMGMEKIQ